MTTHVQWHNWLGVVRSFYSAKSNNMLPSLSPIFVKRNGDNRPYLEIKIYNDEFLALVDTGSCSSVLGSNGFSLLRKWDIPIKYDQNMLVTSADGTNQDYLGYVMLNVTLNNITKMIKILVIPSVQHKLILGIDFLKIFKITANFANYCYDVKIKDEVLVVNTLQSNEDLTSVQQQKLSSLIDSFKEISPSNRIGRTHILEHSINTGTAKPIRQRQYPLSPAMQKHLCAEVDEMLKLGVIQPSKSPWCNPLWLVQKSSGEYRVVLDSRKLNLVTEMDSYPMPLIESVISKLRDAKYLTSIDLKKAFWQIPLDTSSRPKTAFAVQGKGLFEFTVLPFGLSCSSQTMCRLMDMVIGPSLEPYCYFYIDDIVVATPDFDTHINVLLCLKQKLFEAGLTINLEKCQFCRPSLKFLGYIVDERGLRIDDSKVSSILNYEKPKTTTQIRRLIGMVGYYRRFLKNFSSLCSPISDLLKGRKKGQPIVWTPEADKAFEDIKKTLTTAPVLASPDFTKPFIIYCDASNTGVGSVLFQEVDGMEHPVAYASRTLNKCQRAYSTTEKELLSMIFGIEKFRPYIEGTHFTVITDHASLVWLNNISNPSGRLQRWMVKLSQYSFNIVHKKGSLNVVADALSRSPEDNSINVLDMTKLKPDKWYLDMVRRVSENPDLYPSFRVDNNILYKHVFNNSMPLTSNLSDWKIVVPLPNRSEILNLCHDSETAAHLGISKTLSRIQELYYWPNMRKTVYRYVKKCKICATCKSSNLPQAGLMGQYKNINFPFQLISADLLGPYPRSKKGSQYLLVVVDWFTKFVLVQPLAKATSSAIIKFLENNVFLIFGTPQIFVCDNGSVFTSREFKNFMNEYKVQKIWYTARYHPQINATERQNKVIVTAIRSFITDNHKTWDESIFKISQAIRLSRSDATGYSASFLTFGRNVPITGDYYGKIAENAQNIVTISDKNSRIQDIQQLPELFDRVRNNIYKLYEQNARKYNFGKINVKYDVGDRVLKKNYVLSNAANNFSAKLAPKYIPCIVNKIISPLVYSLTDLEGNELGCWHVKDLKFDPTSLDSDDYSDSEHED